MNVPALPIARWLPRAQRAFPLLLAAALAACGGSSSDDDADVRELDQSAMRETVRTLAADLLLPGAVVIVTTPKGEFRMAHGVTTYKGTESTGFDQHVRVGSITKTWTGTVILQQVQEGLLKLDDPVSKYRPEVPNGDHITIDHLLTMRSGLFNYTELLGFNEVMDDEPRKVWAPQELLDLALAEEPYFDPGEGFHYSNTNTVLLGLIAEQLDGGKPLHDIFRDRLFSRLGLDHIALPAPEENTIPEPRARGYMYGDNVLTMDVPPALPEDMQAQARAGTIDPGDQSDANPSWAWSAGSGYATADDLVVFARELVSGTTLLNADMQARRLESIQSVDPDDPASAGYGWALAKFGPLPLYGHTGELPGYNSFMAYDPENDVTVVVWANCAPSVDGRAPATTIARELLVHIYRD